MATLYRDKNSPYWFARFIDCDGRRVSRSTRTKSKREAKAIANDFESRERERRNSDKGLRKAYAVIVETAAREAADGRLTLARAEEFVTRLHRLANPDFQKITLAEHLASWVNQQKPHVTDKTLRVYRDMKRRFIAAFGPGIAKADVGNLTQAQVEKALQKITQTPIKGTTRKIKPATANQDLGCLRRAMRVAVDQGLTKANPAEKVRRLPEDDSTEKVPFTTVEVRQLIDHPDTPEDWKGAILLAAHTGLRMGDVMRLGSQHLEGTRLVIRPEKTKKTRKILTVPLSPPCLAWIGDRQGDFFPTLKDRKAGTLSTQFTRIMKKAGVPRDTPVAGDGTGRRSFHSLRHTFTSWLAEADIHADIRQKLTGHTSAGVHARYTHHDEALERAVATLPTL